MDTVPFVESFRSINNAYLKLIDSLSALRSLSSVSSTFSSDSELLEKALSVLVENQDLERCSIYLLEEERLVNAAGMDWDDLIRLDGRSRGKVSSGVVFALGEGVVGLAAQSGQLQHCQDCEQDPRFQSRCGSGKERMATTSAKVVGSIISVPIQNGQEILGVLNVSHPHVNFFDTGHERSLVIFSNVLSQLLVNNRLLHHMDEQVKERTRQLEKALEDADELRQRYERLSSVDDLTQLHNRRFFFPESRAALARCIRHGEPFSVLLIDVDHFKVINDNFGHASGDVVLRKVAGLIREQLREGDILARFGGEEFILALPNTGMDGTKILAERIRKVIKAVKWQIDGHFPSVTVSIGLSELNERSGEDTQKLLDHLIMEADQALYFGKQHGRDQCQSHADIACKLNPPNS